MGYRRQPLAPLEWYHIYSRGIDKRTVFSDRGDFRRYQKLLYLCNDTEPVNLEMLKNVSFEDTFSLPRKRTLVAIAAYCLMDNHPHIVTQELEGNGIVRFMHKVGTAFTSYFNAKYDRIGNLMVKPFRSKHIRDDRYLRHVVQYVHLNPAELSEPGWKKGVVKDFSALEKKLRSYEYSSLPEYLGKSTRPEASIVDAKVLTMLAHNLPPFRSVLHDVAEYYCAVEADFGSRPRGRPRK